MLIIQVDKSIILERHCSKNIVKINIKNKYIVQKNH